MVNLAELLKVTLPPQSSEVSANMFPTLLGEKRDSVMWEATVHHSEQGKCAICKGDWV